MGVYFYYVSWLFLRMITFFVFFSRRRRHTRGALVTGVQTCALPISSAWRSVVNGRPSRWARREPGRTWAPRAAEGSVVTGSATDGGDRRSGAGGSAGTGTTPYRDVCHPGRTGQCGAGGFFCSPPELRDGGDPSVSGLCAGFGSSGVPTGGRSPARQASMPDSPQQAIHGLLSASPGRDAASAVRCRGFFIGNRRSRSEEHTSEIQSLMRTSYAVF